MPNHDHENTPLVYSTGAGKICTACNQPVRDCKCSPKKKNRDKVSYTDETIRVRREVKGRKGKTVTMISNVPLNNTDLLQLASEMKHKCGTGGSVKEGIILIQGDRVADIILMLEQKGFQAKRSGG